MPHPAASEHLARLEMEVAAHSPTLARRSLADPREARRNLRLVGGFVGRETDVAVDPERRVGRVGPERQSPRLEPLRQFPAQRLERLLEQSLVVCLARLEP